MENEYNEENFKSYREINDEENELPILLSNSTVSFQHKIERLKQDILGNYSIFEGPYGKKPICYVDWTASGRSTLSIENYLLTYVIPLYGNTHTTTSITGHQSTCYRHEARQIIAQAVNAKITGRAAEDIVVFTGNGTTNGINKLVLSLGLHLPRPNLSENEKPVVFISAYEHHSNLLPWRETVADVVTIRYSVETGVCLIDLREKLVHYSSRKVKIGAFSAASNVTGILTDVDSVSILMHKAGGIVIFDYATAAPYVKIDMNPVIISDDSAYAYKDAIIFSGHKFLGGPGAPGVLIVKKKLMAPLEGAPTEPGGGTVFYVTSEHHRYLSNREEREEAGSSNLLGDVKLGLALHLKQTVGVSFIEQEELKIAEYALKRFSAHPQLVVLGKQANTITDSNSSGKFLPIFSFLIRCGSYFLHHNFVCALLNDLFGIQSRGGCMCAGPFSQSLLGISTEDNQRLELALLEKHEVLRPGFSRLSLPFWMSKLEINFVIDAVHFVASHGWRFLPQYRYNHKTGEYAHITRLTRFPERKWLSNLDIFSSSSSSSSSLLSTATPLGYSTTSSEVTEGAIKSIQEGNVENSTTTLKESLKQWGVQGISQLLAQVFESAQLQLQEIISKKKSKFHPTQTIAFTSDNAKELLGFESLRWFTIVSDLPADYNSTSISNSNSACVIQPERFFASLVESSPPLMNDTSSVPIAASAYAMKRELKLGKSTTRVVDASVPRYLQEVFLSTVVSTKSSTETAALTINKITPPAKITNSTTSATVSTSNSTMDVTEAVCETGCNIMRSINLPNLSSGAPMQLDGAGTTYPSTLTEANRKQFYAKHIMPPKKIMKLTGQAVKDWNMIGDGDKLLLGLSGGKDSLALLHILLALQKRAPVRFEIACATVDPQTASFDPTPLIPYLQSLGVTYHYLSQPIVELAKTKLNGDSLCAFCSRFKRGLLYSCCRLV